MGNLSKVNNGGRERGKRANLSLKKGRGIYTPPRIVAVAELQGRIFLSKFGPDISPSPHEKLLRTSRASSRFGAEYFGRIIRPPLKMAKDQKKARRASLRFKAGYFKTGPDIPPRKSEQHENSDNFCIRTPFSMILGSLESPQ
jgi:hypothetical protein